jgi:squalene synthase HpnC
MESPANAPVTSVPKAFRRAGANAVRRDLERFGPDQHQAVSLADARRYCANLTKRHYENFSVASLLVPRSMRQDIANVYAFCRWADDLADESGSSDRAMELLAWWQDSLHDCYQGRTRHPVFVALRETIQQFQIPQHLFHDLVEAFRSDQFKNRYETDQEVLAYCRGSANPVGRIMLYLAGTPNQEQLALSDSVCSGLQIANFCQDVRRDAALNRIYLPRAHWGRFGLDESSILSGSNPSGLRHALIHWTGYAKELLASGLPLVRSVPLWLARDVQLFVRGGLAILKRIEQHNYDVWSSSIAVSKLTKLGLLVRAWTSPRSVSV